MILTISTVVYTQLIVKRKIVLYGGRPWKQLCSHNDDDDDDDVLFCSFAVLDPRVGHSIDALSPFISGRGNGESTSMVWPRVGSGAL